MNIDELKKYLIKEFFQEKSWHTSIDFIKKQSLNLKLRRSSNKLNSRK